MSTYARAAATSLAITLLQGAPVAQAGSPSAPLHPEFKTDALPTAVLGKTAVYKGSLAVVLHAFPGDEVSEHEVYGSTAVVIHGSQPSDTVSVTQTDDGGYRVVVTHEDGSTETFVIQGAPQLLIDVGSDNVHWNGSGKLPDSIHVGRVSEGVASIDWKREKKSLADLRRLTRKLRRAIAKLPKDPRTQMLLVRSKTLERYVIDLREMIPTVEAQDKGATYTQWVSITTQLMSELQQTERELLDRLSDLAKNAEELWAAYSGLKESEARTTRTLIQAFRG